MNILVTAFEPFGIDTVNPTAELLNLLPDEVSIAHNNRLSSSNFEPYRQKDAIMIIKLLLPVSYRRAADMIIEALEHYHPDCVLSLGFAASRSCVTPEAIAVNVMSSSRPDNDGVIADGIKIADDGENAYFTSVDVKALSAHISDLGIPCKVSYHAGTYVCNDIMYSLLYRFSKR